MLEFVKTFSGRFGFGQWSFIGPGSEKKWYSSENSPQGAWDHIVEEMLLEFAESAHPFFRATTPLSRSQLKSKERRKLSIHFAADVDVIDTIYRNILSVNQLSVYRAVAAICEEFEDHQDRSGDPEILMGQSIVLGEVKAEAPFAESGHPIFRSTTPLSRGQLKSKGKGKVSIHFTADQDTVDTIYRIILSVSTEQWQPYARNLRATKIERGNL